mgnify:FL=1
MKSLIRAAAGSFAARSGALSAFERAARGALAVLCYHRVLPEAERARYHTPDLVVTPETLRAHCRILAERYTVAPLGTALAAWQRGEVSDRPLVAITFDDGYRDNMRYATPILRAHGLRATFYVIAGLVDTDEQPWYDIVGAAFGSAAQEDSATGPADAAAALEKAKRLAPAERAAWVAALRSEPASRVRDDDLIMTSGQIRSLADEGHEIGSHSMTHPLLTQCADDALATEMGASRERLSAIAGRAVTGLCYPNGDHDRLVRRAAAAAGYAYAAALDPGLNDRRTADVFALRRWFIAQGRLADSRGAPSDALLRMELSGLSRRLFGRA